MGQQILIIEDFDKLREALKTFLAGRGFEVATAADGLIEEHKQKEKKGLLGRLRG
jgi:DNA-binding response OmpR family regulator